MSFLARCFPLARFSTLRMTTDIYMYMYIYTYIYLCRYDGFVRTCFSGVRLYVF